MKDMELPIPSGELIRENLGYDEGELIEALWELFEATSDEHGHRYHEPECIRREG